MAVTETLAELEALLKRCGMPPRPGLNLIALRGAEWADGIRLTGEEIDAFDDLFCAADFERGTLLTAPCTAGQPGWYWIKHRDYAGPSKGAPFTRPGRYAYVRGPHKGKPALRQKPDESGRLAVIRDLDGDGVPERNERYDYPLDTGINIHASGHFGKVGAASSGCHVLESLWQARPWTALTKLVYTTYASQGAFWYAVLPGQWLRAGDRYLLYGSEGEAVRALQKELGVAQTGFFRRETDEALRRSQRARGQDETGIAVNWGVSMAERKQGYKERMEAPLRALYAAVPIVFAGDEDARRELLHKLNQFDAELRKRGAK